jgi:transcriptional regulator with XRE-family HTH domain
MNGLRILRFQKRLTLKQLADKIGVSVNAVNSWEYGRRKPSFKNMQKLAEFFNCKIDDLI